MIPKIWTNNEIELVRVLTCCINSASYDQLKILWAFGPAPPPFALEFALHRLDTAALLACHFVNIHPPLKPTQPVYSRSPGDNFPQDYLPLSTLLRSRWSQPNVPTKIVVPTKLAANLFGSAVVGLPPLGHRNHDLLLTDAYCQHLRHSLAQAARWVGEHVLPKAGHRRKDPDAFLLDERGEPYRLIESGGSYSVGQIRSLVEYSEQHSLQMELW